MDDAAYVGIGHGLADLRQDAQEVLSTSLRPPAGLEVIGERSSPNELHGEVRPPRGIPSELVDGNDPRVLELPPDLRLLDEPPLELRVGGVAPAEDLHGQVPSQRFIVRPPHLADPAASYELPRTVALESGALAPRIRGGFHSGERNRNQRIPRPRGCTGAESDSQPLLRRIAH